MDIPIKIKVQEITPSTIISKLIIFAIVISGLLFYLVCAYQEKWLDIFKKEKI